MMSYSDNDYFFWKLPHNNIVWKALEKQPLSATRARPTGHVCEGDDLLFQKVDGGINGL